MVFGAKASQDLFDDMMYRIFGDIPRCLNQRDDILIGGTTMEEHNKTLEALFQRAKDFGVTFNLDKCQFGVESLEFYGYLFTKDGLKPTLDKVKAVKESSRPESKEAVRSFFGNDRIFIKVHTTICIHNCTPQKSHTERYKIPLE